MTKTTWLAILLFAAVTFAQQPSTAPTAAPPRSVRISFVPPPLEGTISLGIYDESDQLVRVLHQEAPFDEFTIGPDALVTKWDGKDDFGYDLSTGTYHARGFLVAPMKIEKIAPSESAAPGATESVSIKLISNPLQKNERPTIQLTAGIDDEEALLKTADGLPLLTIAQAPAMKTVSLATRENNSVAVLIATENGTRQFAINGINRMMAFDCGEFELK